MATKDKDKKHRVVGGVGTQNKIEIIDDGFGYHGVIVVEEEIIDMEESNGGKLNRFRNFLGFLGIPTVEICSSEEFPKKIPHLFNIAKEEILMSTTLNPIIYKDRGIKESFKNAINRGVDIQILVDKEGYNVSEIEWLNAYVKQRDIKVFYSKEKIPHIMTVDGKHIREETPHKKDQYKDAENDIIYNAGMMAKINRDTLKIWMKESEGKQIKK